MIRFRGSHSGYEPLPVSPESQMSASSSPCCSSSVPTNTPGKPAEDDPNIQAPATQMRDVDEISWL